MEPEQKSIEGFELVIVKGRIDSNSAFILGELLDNLINDGSRPPATDHRSQFTIHLRVVF